MEKNIGLEIWEFFKKNFAVLALGITLLIMWGQGCIGNKQPPPTITIIRDTVYIVHDTVIYVKPEIIKTIPYIVNANTKPQYIADTNYARLKAQFEALRDKHLAQNIQRDVLPIDSLGTVAVTDTVQENSIIGRSYKTNIRVPIITNTITITEAYKARNQVFIGGGIEAPIDDLGLNDIDIGILLKNKRDNILGISGTYSISMSQPGVRLSYYKIIRLKKR